MPEVTANNSSTATERLPTKQRQLSRFMCQEMLYDYMTKALDSDRQKAVEQYLGYAPDLQLEYKQMQLAENYCTQLSRTRISSTHLEELKQVKSLVAIVTDRFRWINWPDALKWATQAFVISFIIAFIGMVIPWWKIDFHFPKSESRMAVVAPTAPTAPVVADAKSAVADAKPEETGASTPAITIHAEPTKPTEAVAMAAVISAQSAASRPKTVQLQGLIYRLMMTIDKAKELTPEITDKIIKLGAEKAGQVDLGWRKTDPEGSYYHFKMPESSYDELVKTLGAYGPVRIYKNPHERIMPPGEIRIILFIEDKLTE